MISLVYRFGDVDCRGCLLICVFLLYAPVGVRRRLESHLSDDRMGMMRNEGN